MLTSTLFGLLAGLLIGQRFRALALVPVSLAAAGFLATLALVSDLSAGRAALDLLLFAVSLQGAYVVAAALSPAARKARATRPLAT